MEKKEYTNWTADISSAIFDGLDSLIVNETFKALSKESDRNAVIVATSMIDDILSSKIKCLLKAGTSKDHKALFEDNGPFNSMYSKTEWLYCIGELSGHQRKDINILRKMRNEAAHLWLPFDLASDRYNSMLQKMQTYESVNSLKKSLADEHNTSVENILMSPRVCFNLISSLIMTLLGSCISRGGNGAGT